MTKINTDDCLLTSAQVMERLSIGRWKLGDLVACGELTPHADFPGSWRFSASEVDQYIRSGIERAREIRRLRAVDFSDFANQEEMRFILGVEQ